MSEIADYCSCAAVVLGKTVVLGLTVAGSATDPAQVVETVVATATVFELWVLSHLVAKVVDWCWGRSMLHETPD